MFKLLFTQAGSRSEVLDPTEMFICFFGQYQAAVILDEKK